MNALQLKKLEKLQARLKQKTTSLLVNTELLINGGQTRYPLGVSEVFNADDRRVLKLHARDYDERREYTICMEFSRK